MRNALGRPIDIFSALESIDKRVSTHGGAKVERFQNSDTRSVSGLCRNCLTACFPAVVLGLNFGSTTKQNCISCITQLFLPFISLFLSSLTSDVVCVLRVREKLGRSPCVCLMALDFSCEYLAYAQSARLRLLFPFDIPKIDQP